MAQQYTDEDKAQVILDLAQGKAIKAIARDRHMPEATVRYWRQVNQAQPSIAPETKEELDGLVLDLATTAIATLKAVLLHAREPAWLQRQNANDLAIFFGVTVDKIATVLAAFERGMEARSEQALLTGSPSAGG